MIKEDRRSIFEELKVFNPSAKSGDFIELTEWANGEGLDIMISDSIGNRVFALSREELDGIEILSKLLDYNISVEK